MTTLLPCPFCGSKNIDPEGWASTERKGPACDDCKGSADTVELWNARPDTERLLALAREQHRAMDAMMTWMPSSWAPQSQANAMRMANEATKLYRETLSQNDYRALGQ